MTVAAALVKARRVRNNIDRLRRLIRIYIPSIYPNIGMYIEGWG